MVNKVSADPYGIGYCSSAMADPNKVQILGIATNSTRPRSIRRPTRKYRWIVPASQPPAAAASPALCIAWCAAMQVSDTA